MAATVSELSKDYLFQARMRSPDDLAAQKDWLWQLYQALANDDGSEVTATSFEGQSASIQFRGASPEDKQHALRLAIEDIEAQIAGEVANSMRRPFGITFKPGYEPHTQLG